MGLQGFYARYFTLFAFLNFLGPTSCSSSKAPLKPNEQLALVEAPNHAQHILRRLARHLCDAESHDPIIIIPSSTKTSGHLLHLPNHPSFLCSWDGPDCGFGLSFLPNYKNYIVVQDRDNMGPRITIYTPLKRGLLVLTPKMEIRHVQKPAILHPKNLTMPFISLKLPRYPTTHMKFDDILLLIMSIRECMADDNAETLEDLTNWSYWERKSRQESRIVGIMDETAETRPDVLLDRLRAAMQSVFELKKCETSQGCASTENPLTTKVPSSPGFYKGAVLVSNGVC